MFLGTSASWIFCPCLCPGLAEPLPSLSSRMLWSLPLHFDPTLLSAPTTQLSFSCVSGLGLANSEPHPGCPLHPPYSQALVFLASPSSSHLRSRGNTPPACEMVGDPSPAFLEPHQCRPGHCVEPHHIPSDNSQGYETLTKFHSILQSLVLYHPPRGQSSWVKRIQRLGKGRDGGDLLKDKKSQLVRRNKF